MRGNAGFGLWADSAPDNAGNETSISSFAFVLDAKVGYRITPEMARSYSQVLSYSWGMSMLERNNAKLVWDDVQKASYAYFPVGGTWEWIFVEDVRTFRAKEALIAKYKLRGFSVWVLGPEDPAIWN